MSNPFASISRKHDKCLSGLQLEVHDDLEYARADWQRFQTLAAGTPHQTFEWVSTWHGRLGAGSGLRPRIVIGRDHSGAILFILPFGISRHLAVRVLEWLGGDHGNFASGLFSREASRSARLPRFEHLWQYILGAAGPVDAVHLSCQPEDLGGYTNPLAELAGIEASEPAHWFPLGPDWEAHYRSRFSAKSRSDLRRAERALARQGEVRTGPVIRLEERLAVFDWMVQQKRHQLQELGAADMFAEDGTRCFYRALLAMPQAQSPIDICLTALRCGGEVLAANMGVIHQNRFHGLVMGTTHGPMRKHQPGKILFRDTVAHLAETGVTAFDGGVGGDEHKLRWCSEERPLFQTLVPVTTAGAAYIAMARAHLRAKQKIKTSPQLWSAYRTMRRLTGRAPFSSAPAPG